MKAGQGRSGGAWCGLARVLGVAWALLAGPAAWAQEDGGLAIVGGPEFETQPGPGWRITWRSEPGRVYRLERSVELRDPEAWEEVATVTAAETLSEFVDTAELPFTRRFWRVRLLGGEDTQAPSVGPVEAWVKQVNGELFLELRVVATDDTGVVGVVFLGRAESLPELELLGDGTRDSTDGLWKLVTALPPEDGEARVFAARASDAAGNVGESVETSFAVSTAAQFAALGADGLPQPGAVATVDGTGALGAFGLRAGGGGGAGASADLLLLFPAGGRIVEVDGRDFIEFTEGEVRFGAGSPLELREPLSRGAAAAGAGAQAGPLLPALLPVDGVMVADLEAAFGLAPGSGIGVKLFGVFDLRLMSGTFSLRGIEGAVFALEIADLPLPGLSGAYAGFTVDFSEPGALRLPFHGEFQLPEAGGPGASLRVPRSRPILLTLRADGSIALAGRVELNVPGAGRFAAELTIDDPNYAFGLSAAGVEIPFLDSFAELLPDDAPGLVPPTTDAAQLAFATRALESYARSFFDFSAAAAAAAPVPANLEDGGIRPPGDAGAALARLLDAWSFAAASPVVREVADDAILAATARLARIGSGATDIISSLDHLTAAARLRAVLQDPDFAAALPGMQEQLDEALAELVRAVTARSREPGAAASLDTVLQATRLLLDAEAALQLTGSLEDLSEPLRGAIADLWQRFLADFTRASGVAAGQFDPAANPRISTLSRFLAVERVIRLVDALAILQLLGIADSYSDFGVPGDELLTQFIARAASALRAELAAAEVAGDARTFLELHTDLLDLAAARQLGLLPDDPAAVAVLVANGLPQPFDFESLESRYAAVRDRDVTLDLGTPGVADAAREVARINRLADRIPGELTLAVAPARRALERLDAALGAVVAGVGDLDDPVLLAEVIAAGSQHARLTRRLAGAPEPGAPWETARLPALADRFVAIAPAARPWAELHRSSRLLLAEADQLALEAEDPALTVGERTDRIAARRNNLVEAAKLVQAARGVASAVWLETEAALAAAGQFGIDALLPGNIEVSQVAGGFAFNRLSGAWSGSLSGQVKLPGLLGGSSLTLQQATFSSSGEYEAVAFGNLNGVPLGELSGDFEVPARRPLRIRHQLGRPLAIAGGAKLSLSNGIFFEGYLDFEDPVYRFGAAAGGVRFDLADKFIGYTPQITLTLPFEINANNEVIIDPAFTALSRDTAEALTEWFSSLGATLEPVAGLLTTPQLGAPGTPPAFQEPAFVFEFDAVNTFFNGLAQGAALNLDAAYGALLEDVMEELRRAAAAAESSPSAIDNFAVYLQILRRAEEMERISARLRLALDELAANQAAGLELGDISDDPRVVAFHEQAQSEIDKLFTSPLTANSLDNARRVARLATRSDATGQQLGLEGSFFIARLPEFAESTYGPYLQSLGLDPASGEVADPTVFNALTRRQLAEGLRELSNLRAEIQLVGGANIPGSTFAALSHIALRLRERAIQEYAVTAEDNWEQREKLLREVFNVTTLVVNFELPVTGAQLRIGGGSGPLSLEVDAQAAQAEMIQLSAIREADLRNRAANPIYEFLAALRRVTQSDFPEQVLESARRDIQRDIDRHLPAILALLPTDAIPDSRRILLDLLAAAEAAAEFSFTEQLDQLGKVAIPNLTIRLAAIAEAQKAWWVLGDYTRLLLEAGQRQALLGSTVIRGAIEGSVSHSLEFGRRVTNAIAADVAARISAGAEPFELRLPGDLVVHRVFGDFVYERQIPRFTATFGGKLEFPEIETFLDIDEATLSSDGSFRLDVRTKGPVESGGDSLKYELALQVNGSAGGVLQDATGAGKLRVKKAGAAPAAPEDLYEATVQYRPQAVAPQPVFKIAGEAEGIFIFDTNLVVFEAQASLEFTRGARTGKFGLGGTAGTLAKRDDFTRDDVQRGDFRLLFEEVSLEFEYRPDGFSASIGGGRAVLDPELFGARIGSLNCGDLDNPAQAPGTPQAPFAELLTPLVAEVTFLPEGGAEFAFRGGPDGTALGFGNFGFEIPGVPGLVIDVCSAGLLFPENGFPRLTNLDARLTIPLEEGPVTLGGPLPEDPDGFAPAASGAIGKVVRTRLGVADWGLDGFPSELSVSIENDLVIIDEDAFAVTVLGESCEAGAATLSFFFENGGLTTGFLIAAGVRVDLDTDLLFDMDAQSGVSLAACGEFGLTSTFNPALGTFQLQPTLLLTELQFCGRFRIGGEQGFEITGTGGAGTNACLTLSGLANLFNPGPEDDGRAFSIGLDGRAGFGELGFFSLNDARFVFEGEPLPRFRVAGFLFEAGEALKLFQQDLMPLRITQAGLCFVNPDAPLDQLFALDNVEFLVSGEVVVGLPGFDDSAGGEGGLPRLSGAVECLRVSFPQGFEAPPSFSIDGLVLQLENLSIGDMGGLTGAVALGNLNDTDNLFFAGKLGGGFNGVGITVILAASLQQGPIGLCLDVSAGPAGIPLDGGTLGGILLTGARGGVSFGSRFANPCDFKSLLGLRDDGRPEGSPSGDPGSGAPCGCGPQAAPAMMTASAMSAPVPAAQLAGISWEQLAARQRAHEAARESGATSGTIAVVAVEEDTASEPEPAAGAPQSGGGDDNPPNLDARCPTGDCPPPTINLFCQPHPSVGEESSDFNYNLEFADRVIFKLSSLDRATVDQFLALAGLNPADLQGTPETISTEFALAARIQLEELLQFLRPGADLQALNPQLFAELDAAVDEALDNFEDGLRAVLEAALTAATGDPDTSLLEALYKAAYGGAPCIDITIVLAGTFSHSVVSTVLTVTGGVAASTTGTAGINGSLNLLGIPVGTAEFYYSLTDRVGDPNPSFCGGAFLGIGPLQLGTMDFVFECEGCITGILQALADFIGGVANDAGAQADALLREWIAAAMGVPVAQVTAPLPAYFGPFGALLTDQQQVAVLAQLYNLPELVAVLGAGAPAAAAQLRERVFDLLVDVGLAVNPTFSFCGSIEPKIFGIPLSGGSLLGANLFYGRIEDGGVRFDELAAQVNFSPSWVMLNYGLVLSTGGLFPPVIPGFDNANMGFATRVQSFDRDSLRAYLEDPVGGTLGRMQQVIENAIITFGYQMEPLGIRLADGQARIMLPQLDYHPKNPNRVGGAWTSPDPAQFATRKELLFAALRAGRIDDPTWRGRAGQLGELFLPDDPALAANMDTLDLARDYFPHGGIIGAAEVFFPKPISDPPPQALFNLFAPDRSLEQRWTDLNAVVNDYLLATSEDPIGTLALYFPAPNPPAIFWNGLPNPLSFVEAIQQNGPEAILANVGDLDFYAFDQTFMSGEVSVRVLGLEVANGQIELEGGAGRFLLTAAVPPGGWLDELLGATAFLEFRVSPPRYASGGAGTGFLPEEQALLPTPAEVFLQVLAAVDATVPGSLERDAAIEDGIATFLDTLPRVSLEAGVALDLTGQPLLQEFLQLDAAAATFELFAFSPAFEPDFVPESPLFDPLNPDPYTEARRKGGAGFRGSLVFGHFPSGVSIVVEEASLALSLGGPSNIFPALNGLLRVPTFTLPGGYAFEDGLLQFNSQPVVGGDYIHVRGRTSPIDLGPFLQIQPLDDPEPDEPPMLSASFRVTNSGGLIPFIGLSIDPARASMPFLGDSLAIDIFGDQDPETGDFTPFTFSSVPGQEWQATLRVSGALQVRDPLNLGGPVLLEVSTAGGIPFIATMAGTGTDSFTLRVTMPNGVTLRAFPGQPTEAEWTVGDANASCILIEKIGGVMRLYYDSGTRVLPLIGGAMEATGRVEFGFEPFVLTPALDASPASLSFGNVAATNSSATQTVTVQNTGFGRLVVDADVTLGNTHFTAQPNRLVLGPLQVGTITVRYTPQTVAAHSGTLALTSEFGNASIPLSGTGTGTAAYHANPTTVAFGSVTLGTQQTRPLTITNAGTTNLTWSSATVTGPYAISHSSATVPPGTSRTFTVTFAPQASGTQNGSVVLATNLGNRTINFTGSGNLPSPMWYRQLRGGPDLRGGHSLLADIGWVVGDAGTVLRTRDGGKTWLSVGGKSVQNWNDIVFEFVASGTVSLPNDLRGLIVGAGGRVEISRDSGDSWEPFVVSNTVSVDGITWRTAARRSHQRFSIAGGRKGLAVIATEQERNGAWEVVEIAGTGAINGVAFMSERFADNTAIRFAIAAGENGALLRSTDGGKTWDPVPLPAGVPAGTRFVAASASQQNTVADRRFMVIGQPDILMTSPDGLAWTVHPLPASLRGQLTCGAWTGNTVGQIGTSEGQIYRVTSAGASFSQQFDQPTVPLRKVLHNRQTSETGGDSGNIWIVGDQGTVMRRPANPTAPLTTYRIDTPDFGAVAVGATAHRTITVSNSSASPVTVTPDLSGSSDFSVFPKEGILIGPGESVSFTVSFKADGTGARGATLTLLENGTASQVLQFSATGLDAAWVPVPAPSGENFTSGAQIDKNTYALVTERSIYRTTNDGATWSLRLQNAAGPLAAVSFANPFFGVAAGGIGGPAPANSLKSTFYSTDNGGLSWTLRNSPQPTRVADVHYIEFSPTDRRALAITEEFGATLGRVLESSNSATSWFTITGTNLDEMPGRAIWGRQGEVFAAAKAEVYYYSTAVQRWEKVRDATGSKAEFRDIFFISANVGWIVGDEGNVHTTTSGGGSSGAWTNRSNAALGDIKQVRFINVSTGWIVTETATDTRIYGSFNGGVSWQLQHVEPKQAGGHRILGLMGNKEDDTIFAMGTNGGLWRLQPADVRPIGFAHLPARIDLGGVGLGQTAVARVPAINLGGAEFIVLDAVVEARTSPSPFSAGVGQNIVFPTDEGIVAEVFFSPVEIGEFRGTLRVLSTAFNAEAEIEVVGRGVPSPATITVASVPSGAPILVGGTNYNAPAVFTVVDSGGTAGGLNWNRGTERTLVAPLTRSRNGVSYRFSHWSSGGDGATITVTAGNTSAQYVAHYVQSLPVPAAPAAPPVFLPNPCANAGPPDDVPQGPWLKISEAVVRFPDIDGGHRTAVEGALLLSLTRANGVLRTSAFRLTSQPPSGGFEIVEVTAGSWRFDLEGFDFTFRANNPGIELFDRPAVPPSTFLFRASWNPQTPFAPPLVAGEFNTLGDLPVVPGIIEFGPSTVQFALSPELGLGVAGTAKLLRRPQGGFAFTRPFEYTLGNPTPVQGSGTVTLLDFGFARLRGDGQTQLVLQQDAAGVWTVGATGLLLDGWGLSQTRVGTEVQTDGTAKIFIDPPVGGVQVGALRFKPVSTDPVLRRSQLEWNLFRGVFKVSVPQSQINSVIGFWPDGTFTHPGLEIDSTADFEFRIPLPSVVGGISMQLGNPEDNYLIFERKNRQAGFRVRNEQDVLFGAFRLRFAATSSFVTGSFSGEARLPAVGTRLGAVSLQYNSFGAPYEFEGRFAFIPNFSVLFGTGGALFCTLDCGFNQPLEDCSIGSCFP